MGSVFVSVFFLFSHLLLLPSAEEEMTYTQKCPPFTCGNLETVGFPFTNKTKPECGLFTVVCQDERSTIQPVDGGKSYVVISVSESNTLHIIDSELLERLKSNSCEAFTNLSLPRSSFFSFELLPNQTFFKCNHTLSVSPPPSFKTMPCNHSDIYYSISDHSFPSSFSGCSIIQLPKNLGEDPGSPPDENNPFSLVTHVMDVVVRVSDKCYKCFHKGGQCKANSEGRFYCDGAEKETHRLTAVQVAIVIGASSLGVGILLVIICYFRRKFSSSSIIYDWRKKSLSQQTVQAFLRNHGPLTIRRYSYSNIKTMTNSFKDKLGEGGYGSVYKGMLQDGCLVAVKILKQSKENGEEFINEVTSISRTSHVNIVSLIGFCFEGPKRALIYEFMPNGSLEKFIHLSKDKFQLEWETLYKIALGIARGLEYLHRGCNTRILHFDIKPHNILLDENFCPKISDFGLAKICSREESIVSMLVARGTAGYIAPEVFCRNFGGVSHKSDVYSYGMMIFEMIEGRKNVEVDDDCASEIFFPHLVYRHLEQDEKLGLQGLKNEKDHESARKMILVSLWCIQTDPSNRPSMSRVVNMLEGLEPLQVPPMPFLCSPSRSQESSSTTMGSLQYGSKIF